MVKGLWRKKEILALTFGMLYTTTCLSIGTVSIHSPPHMNQTSEVHNTDSSSFHVIYSSKINYSEEKSYSLNAIAKRSRYRRNVVQMARMLKCMSGCNPLSYRGYGCYCGYMGSGQPVDEIDRCCLQHDWCYTFISCSQTLIYFVPYTWQCMNPGAAHCGVASVPGISQKCATQLCECDREFARCISNYPCPRKKPGCKANNYVIFQTISNNDI